MMIKHIELSKEIKKRYPRWKKSFSEIDSIVENMGTEDMDGPSVFALKWRATREKFGLNVYEADSKMYRYLKQKYRLKSTNRNYFRIWRSHVDFKGGLGFSSTNPISPCNSYDMGHIYHVAKKYYNEVVDYYEEDWIKKISIYICALYGHGVNDIMEYFGVPKVFALNYSQAFQVNQYMKANFLPETREIMAMIDGRKPPLGRGDYV